MLRLIFFQIGCLVSSLLMLAFRASETALWMGTSTFGLFMSNVFPTSVALAEQYFNVTGLSNRSAQFYRPLIFLLFRMTQACLGSIFSVQFFSGMLQSNPFPSTFLVFFVISQIPQPLL